MLLNLVLAFSLARLFLHPKTKAQIASYEFVGDALIAINVIHTIYKNPWFLQGVREDLFVQHERHHGFDFHCLLETAWYISLLPYCQDMGTLAHHGLSAGMAIYGLNKNTTYLGFMVLGIMVWSNVFLAASRIMHYNNNPLAKHAFRVFAVVYFVMRIGVFPFWYMRMMLFRVWPLWMAAGMQHTCYIMNGGLLIITGMQFVWFRRILRIASN
jgi:hypothetical protein